MTSLLCSYLVVSCSLTKEVDKTLSLLMRLAADGELDRAQSASALLPPRMCCPADSPIGRWLVPR